MYLRKPQPLLSSVKVVFIEQLIHSLTVSIIQDTLIICDEQMNVSQATSTTGSSNNCIGTSNNDNHDVNSVLFNITDPRHVTYQQSPDMGFSPNLKNPDNPEIFQFQISCFWV